MNKCEVDYFSHCQSLEEDFLEEKKKKLRSYLNVKYQMVSSHKRRRFQAKKWLGKIRFITNFS